MNKVVMRTNCWYPIGNFQNNFLAAASGGWVIMLTVLRSGGGVIMLTVLIVFWQ